MQGIPYLSDPTIVPRVQKYLEANMDKAYVDINVMADELQKKYKEYGRRKRNAFRSSVKKAYSIVMRNYEIGEDNASTSEELSEESAAAEDISQFPENTMNNQLLQMYSRRFVKPADDNELIDISSDDSADSPQKSTNGASTSHLKTDTIKIENKVELPLSLEPKLVQTVSRKRKLESNASMSGAKKKRALVQPQGSSITFDNMAGIDNIFEEIFELVEPIKHPEIYRPLRISAPKGFLLHGPPGCGKTMLAHAIAGELGLPLFKVAAPELVTGVSGESEERIRELFERAAVSAPCVVFIDEIDAITQNRQNAQKDMERRIVSQLIISFDDLNKAENGDQVLVIGATNRPDSLDPALRRTGRFDNEICLGMPNLQSRTSILKKLATELRMAEGFDYESLAKLTPGFVGADLVALVSAAGRAAVKRIRNEIRNQEVAEPVKRIEETIETQPEEESNINELNKSDSDIIIDPGKEEIPPEATQPQNITDNAVVVIDDDVKNNDKTEPESPTVNLEATPVANPETSLKTQRAWLGENIVLSSSQLANLYFTMEDFVNALKKIQPSAKREGFATVPDVTWDDVGSLRDVRDELEMAILAPVKYPEAASALSINVPTGVLLFGPPGCGKTLVAKAIANEAGINFISVKGPELLNMYLGESERAVRSCFERAKHSAPCVIFFDELDALCPKRSDSGENGAASRVVNQMLTEMDGVEGREGVYLLAASNRPDIIDPAVLRPGRIDTILYVGLPTRLDRVDILRAVTKNGTKPVLAADVDLEAIGKSEQCDGYTGAHLAALVRRASTQAMRDFMSRKGSAEPVVNTEHFKEAAKNIKPISEKDQKHYLELKQQYMREKETEGLEEMDYS